jgi:hypothetical protein
MRCRSAIPAPPRRFRKTPGRRQRKCIGGITAITVGIAGTTTIIATGTVGEGSLIEINRPASSRAYFYLDLICADIAAIKPARLLRVILAARGA